MKLSTILAASSIRAAPVSSSPASLHQKGRQSIFDGRQRSNEDTGNRNDDMDDDVASLIHQYHIVNNGFHSLDKTTFRQADSASFAPSPAGITNAAVGSEPDGAMASTAPTPFGAFTSSPPSLVIDDGFYYDEAVDTTAADDALFDYPVANELNDAGSAPVATSLSDRQFQQCKADMSASDANGDSLLSYAEYMNFLMINSANNGYGQFLTGGTTLRLGNLPYEYTLAFYGTACLCALLGEGGDCCLGNRTTVHIFYHVDDGENVTVTDNATVTDTVTVTPDNNSTQVFDGDGTATTIDVGGAENGDFDSGGIVDVDVSGSDGTATATPGEYENSLWRDLPPQIQYAYTILGYNETSWDEGFPIPESQNMTWDELSFEMRAAAIYIGYTQEMWDGERRRRMDVVGNADATAIHGAKNDTLVDGSVGNATINEGSAQNATVVDGVDATVVDSGEENDTGVHALLDQERYTRNFCTEVYLAYGVTKAPTYAPTTYPPTVTKITMNPSIAPSKKTIPVPSTSSPVDMLSTTPTYKPTRGTGAPIVSSPVSLPPVGGGNVPSPIPSATGDTGPPVLSSPVSLPPVGAGNVPTPIPSATGGTGPPILSSPVSLPPVGGGNVPTPIPSATGGTVAPVLSSPVSLPPVGGGNAPTPNPNPLPTTIPPVSLSSSTPTVSRTTSLFPTAAGSKIVTTPPISSPTASPAAEVVTGTFSPSSASSNLYSVFLQYGISSNCGVTAFDVINANNNTIAEGLVKATETFVVNILNDTFPRDENGGVRSGGPKIFHEELTKTFAEIYAEAASKSYADKVSEGFELTHVYVSNNLGLIRKQSGTSDIVLDEATAEADSTNIEKSSFMELIHEQSHLFDVDTDTNHANNRAGQNKRKRKKKIRQSKQKTLGFSNNTRKLPSLPSLVRVTPHEYRRNLVYYTPTYPITITDVEDVLDQACPAGVNCMKVFSTVKVVLEEGDDADAVENAITQGVAAGFSDGSFFQAIPPETIFCPGETAPPFTSSTDRPAPTTLAPASAPLTSQPSAGPKALSTTQPSLGSIATPTIAPSRGFAGSESTTPSTLPVASTINPTLVATNVPPWALPAETESPTAEVGTTSIIPTFSPTATLTQPTVTGTSLTPTTSPSSANSVGASSSPSSSSSSTPPAGNLRVQITYDIANDCGLDSTAIMNETNNTLKKGLIAATTISAIDILNQTFPRVESTPSRKSSVRATRQLERNTLNSHHSLSQAFKHAVRRNLVYYTDEFPVTIDRIIDVTEDCAEGNSCLLIVSTITTVLEPGDDSDAVKNALIDGMTESFNTDSFYENIPPDTVICPGERRK